jgi:uncharacterized repeat protein (TIGR04076 family)
MKKFITENKSFTITVIDHAKDGKPLHCRNGHEIGDTYTCEYGCPMPTNGCGGFCSKTMTNLYRLKEIVYANGDLRILGFPNNHDIEFFCPDGAVKFRMQIHDLAGIHPLTAEHLPQYAEVIRRSFATVAKDFGLTRENCPDHTSFVTDERLASKVKDGYFPFGLCVGETIFGFASLTDMSDGVFEMNDVSVLPEWRHYGYGKKMIDFCKEKVKELGGSKITIGIVDENAVLKDWYAANGFVHKETKNFDGLPFTVGFMEWSAI